MIHRGVLCVEAFFGVQKRYVFFPTGFPKNHRRSGPPIVLIVESRYRENPATLMVFPLGCNRMAHYSL
jgi:hypothetical protein